MVIQRHKISLRVLKNISRVSGVNISESFMHFAPENFEIPKP